MPDWARALLEGVGLLHVGKEDLGELRAVVGLDFLNGERNDLLTMRRKRRLVCGVTAELMSATCRSVQSSMALQRYCFKDSGRFLMCSDGRY